MPTKLFQKGRTKTGGRVKGTPNKFTKDFETNVMEAVNDPAWLLTLKATRPEILASLSKAFIAKRINLGGQPDNEINFRILGRKDD